MPSSRRFDLRRVQKPHQLVVYNVNIVEILQIGQSLFQHGGCVGHSSRTLS